MTKFILAITFILTISGCREHNDSDSAQTKQQERILSEGTSAVGMPAIKNFRERKLLKDIFELRDQDGLVTYTYLFSEQSGKLTFFCNSVGYGIPYATQFTNPQKLVNPYGGKYVALPQADPNGLFSPESADGTWILCSDPVSQEVRPQYVEPKLVVLTYKLPE